MNFQIFLTSFLTIFLAEMGDKTQIAALTLSASQKDTWSVGLAVVLALSLAGIIGVIAGKWLGGFLNPDYLKWASGILFIAIGVFTIVKG